jgi:hypothetical protein
LSGEISGTENDLSAVGAGFPVNQQVFTSAITMR